MAALTRDAARFEHGTGLVWGLARERRPEVLVVGRIVDGRGRWPLDRFVGIPRYPWTVPHAIDLLRGGTGTIGDQELVTAFGEVVRADLFGLIFPGLLADAASDELNADPSRESFGQILKGHLSPRRAVRLAEPELFTWNTVFNNARDLWPGVTSLEQIAQLSPAQQGAIANHFLGYGLEALAAESDDFSVRLAARHLIQMCDQGLVDLRLTSQPYAALHEMTGQDRAEGSQLLPEEHGLAYVLAPDAHRPRPKGTILVPLHWIAAALQREIVALVHLARMASMARDNFFGKLTGKVVVNARELRPASEVNLQAIAVARADSVAGHFLAEALRYDTRVYGLQVQRDAYCDAIERTAHRLRPCREARVATRPAG